MASSLEHAKYAKGTKNSTTDPSYHADFAATRNITKTDRARDARSAVVSGIKVARKRQINPKIVS